MKCCTSEAPKNVTLEEVKTKSLTRKKKKQLTTKVVVASISEEADQQRGTNLFYH